MLPIQNLCCLFQTSNLLPKNRISTSDSEGFTQTSASAWCLPSDDIHRLDCEGHSIVCPSTNFLRIVFEFQSSVFHYLALVHIPSPKQINNHQNKNLFPWRMDIHGHCPNFAKTTAEDEDVANFRVWISNEPLVFQFLLLIADFRVSNRQLGMSMLVGSRLNIFPEKQHFPKLKKYFIHFSERVLWSEKNLRSTQVVRDGLCFIIYVINACSYSIIWSFGAINLFWHPDMAFNFVTDLMTDSNNPFKF